MKKIGIGADDAALELKATLIERLEEKGYEVQDYGIKEYADYPDVAVEVAEAVARGEHDRAILCCGTGLGMSITANKVPGVRAAQCHDVYSAERARDRAEQIGARLLEIFAMAEERGVSTEAAAEVVAEQRMASVGRLRGFWLPRG